MLPLHEKDLLNQIPNMLYIPANITKAALHQILDGTKGSGVIFETEGDTLVEALKTEHGGFSDILRKGISTRSLTQLQENKPRTK